MRLFVGIGLPEDVSAGLVEVLQPTWGAGHDVAWTRPGGWHVTLAYLGETDAEPDAVAAITRSAVAAEGPATLRLGAPTWFDRAWVLGVDDDPDGWCARVGASVQQAVDAAGLPVVRRAVHPHVTLGRTRGRRGSERATPPDLPAPDVAGVPAWTTAELAVFASETGDGPARYPVVATAPLDDGGA